MDIVGQILTEWRHNDPDRLLARAIEQAEHIAELRAGRELLQSENCKLLEQVREQNRTIAELHQKLAAAETAAARQAAPFRRSEKRKTAERKRPGRKRGHPGGCRKRPLVDQEITIELTSCPCCGSQKLFDQLPVEQVIEEIPPVRPIVTRLTTYRATCADCGEMVSSTHPLKVSNAVGAAGTQLGPRALALAADLNKAQGLTTRRTCRILQSHFGLSLSQGGACAGDVFTNADSTLYAIAAARNRQIVQHYLGTAYPGILVSDCLVIYDDTSPRQQKCYAHHLKAISHARQKHSQGGVGFLAEVEGVLKAAMALKVVKPELPITELTLWRQALQGYAERLLQFPRSEPAEESVRNRLSKQIDHLFTFLDHAEVDATNNLAERQLRPAVIARKLSCGNKTERGASTWQIHASLAATCVQRGESFVDLVAQSARLGALVQ